MCHLVVVYCVVVSDDDDTVMEYVNQHVRTAVQKGRALEHFSVKAIPV